jgi:prepilin-type N-terminal cleavage/methylation domain-containing protein
MNNKREQRGFSLIELLIVVAVLGIVTALAIPNILATRRAANEGSAHSSLRTIVTTQHAHQATFGGGAFASAIGTLQAKGLIDPVLSSGTKSGYDFAIVGQGGTGSGAVFGCYAFPVVSSGASQTGARRLGVTEIGVLRGDTDMATIPNTITLINNLAVLGN